MCLPVMVQELGLGELLPADVARVEFLALVGAAMDAERREMTE